MPCGKRRGQPEAKRALEQAAAVLASSAEFSLYRLVLIDAVVDLGELAEAEAEVEKMERQFAADTRPLPRAITLTARARLLVAQGQLDEAEHLLQGPISSLKWLEHFHGRMHTELVLARCLIQASRFEDAERLLLSLQTRAERRNLPAEAARRILKLLVDLYTSWNKPDEAARWREQLPGIADDQ